MKTEQMLKEVKERRRQWLTTRKSDFDWLIEQAEKVVRYEKEQEILKKEYSSFYE